MRVRFWGTRGSIGVSLTAADVRDKLAQALLQASGKMFASYEEAHAYATAELDFSITHTFGGHTPCVEIEPATCCPMASKSEFLSRAAKFG